MQIRVADNGGKTNDRYTVLIGRDYWTMSIDANQPNGVCMYAGYTDGAWMSPGSKEIQLGDCPRGVLVQIIHLLNTK